MSMTRCILLCLVHTPVLVVVDIRYPNISKISVLGFVPGSRTFRRALRRGRRVARSRKCAFVALMGLRCRALVAVQVQVLQCLGSGFGLCRRRRRRRRRGEQFHPCLPDLPIRNSVFRLVKRQFCQDKTDGDLKLTSMDRKLRGSQHQSCLPHTPPRCASGHRAGG